ncbi:MAG: SDR family oxidoreductase [Aeriscardovia sp.]|nr:SDR family oxidoreductase [Aeriscardovia sp.]
MSENTRTTLVLGASGRTGSLVVADLLAEGRHVVAYVRRPEAMKPANGLTVIGGQLDDVAAMTAAAAGCDSILVTLGMKGMDFSASEVMAGGPAPEGRTPVITMAMSSIIAVAKANDIRRVVVLSALGVGATIKNSAFTAEQIANSPLDSVFRDHENGEALLRASGLDWTTVHPGFLTSGPATAHPVVIDAASGRKLPGRSVTSRADVAAVLVHSVDDPATIDKQLIVMSEAE